MFLITFVNASKGTMFLGFFKRKSLKKIVKKGLPKTHTSSKNKIKTVGLLIDGAHSNDINKLIDILTSWGINKEHIKVLVYTHKTKTKIKDISWEYFSLKNISLAKRVTKKEQQVRSFQEESFDLLINYFAQKDIAMTYVGMQSKADFKVGITREGKQINDLVIDLPTSEYKFFMQELYKYLKLFDKI